MKKYYRLHNKDEIHYGFQYKDGLNILFDNNNNNNNNDFKINKTVNLSNKNNGNGLYYSDGKHIFNFINSINGEAYWIREIILIKNKNCKNIKVDGYSEQWKTNMINITI
jgi:hypothetical protein